MSGLSRSGGGDVPFLARDVMLSASAISIDTFCGKVVTSFVESPDLPCLAVVNADQEVVGVVGRERLLATFAQQLLADLYRRRPITSFLETEFLSVDVEMDIDSISEVIASHHPRALVGGFVVTEGGRYAGIGTGISLLSKAVTLTRLRLDEIEAARFEAEQANRAKSTFLASMSHEIRTPLNGVIGNLELLKLSDCSEEQADLIVGADTAAQTLLQIIGDVLDFSKIESDKIDLEEVEMSPAEVVREVVALFTSKARQRNLILTWSIGAGIPERIIGDPLRLRQVVMNFVNNAIKFTEVGGIHVGLARVWQDEGECRLRFEVSDTGLGFKSEKAESLFEPFVQEDGSTTRRFGGTGLGLAICKRLGSLMAGSVGANGEPGMGATFWLEVPVKVLSPALPAVVPALAGEKVLLVDGGWGGTAAAAPLLTKAGAEVETASTLLDAVAKVRLAESRYAPFAVVVIDDMLPDGNSFVLAEAVAGETTRFAMTVDLGNRITARRARKRGFLAAIDKPCPPEEVALAVATMLRRPVASTGETVATDARARLRGLAHLGINRPLLVIDDTPMNREVAKRQLAKLGLDCETAADGLEGLTLATSRSYAAILVDGSMPVLDGYEFTRRYRAWEREIGRRVPVIAMTAHALADDVEKSLSAGMDDHLTKPVTIGRLATMLEQWLKPAGSDAPAAPDAVAEGGDGGKGPGKVREPEAGAGIATASPPIDLVRLSDILGGAEDDEIDEVLDHFVRSFDGLMVRLDAAVGASDPVALRDAAHAAKSAARNCAAIRLGNVLAEIEASAQNNGWDRLSLRVGEVRAGFGEIREFVHSRCQ